MTAPSLLDTENLPDTLDNARFQLVFGQLPGVSGNSQNLTLSVTTTSYPGFGNEVMDAPVNAHVRRFRGRKTYPRTVTFTADETVDFNNITSLQQWNEYIVGTNSGNSQGYKADYSVNADLYIFDTIGIAIEVKTMWYSFLTDVTDVNVSGEATALFQLTGSLSYDYCTSSNVSVN